MGRKESNQTNKGANQTALVYSFVVHKHLRQIFSRRGPYMMLYIIITIVRQILLDVNCEHIAVFHLDLHCLPGVSSIQRINDKAHI